MLTFWSGRQSQWVNYGKTSDEALARKGPRKQRKWQTSCTVWFANLPSGAKT